MSRKVCSKSKSSSIFSGAVPTYRPGVRLQSFLYGGAKIWGQHTDDDRFAVFYNPHESRRYPLVVSTSNDGVAYDNLWAVHGEVPEQRYKGAFREAGPQYVRGIEEGTGNPPGDAVWLSYSMNKEDIWVASVPAPIGAVAPGWVDDDFDEFAPGPVPEGSTYEEVEGNVVIHNRIFMTSVAAVVVSRSDTEMVVLVEDGSVFF